MLIREAERQAQEAKYATIDETAAAQAVQLKPNAWGGDMDLSVSGGGQEMRDGLTTGSTFNVAQNTELPSRSQRSSKLDESSSVE